MTIHPPNFHHRFLGREFGLELLAERSGEIGVAGLLQLLEQGFNAGDGGRGRCHVGVEQRGDEVGRDGFHWLALLEEFFKIGLGGFPKSTLQRGRRRASKFGTRWFAWG